MNIKCKNRAALRHFGNYIWAASLETANGWLRVSADSRALRKMVANARSCLLLWLFFLPDKSCSFSGHILAWLAGWVFHFAILEKGPHSVIQTGFRLSPTPLSQPPNCWDNDDQSPCPAISGLWLASSSQYSFPYSSDWTSICYRKTAFANIRKPATCAPVDRIRDGNTKDMGCCKRSGPAFRPTTRLT